MCCKVNVSAVTLHERGSGPFCEEPKTYPITVGNLMVQSLSASEMILQQHFPVVRPFLSPKLQ